MQHCQKIREANGINSLVRVAQAVVEECARSPTSYEPSRTGVEKALRVLKYLCLNDNKAGDARRILQNMTALREILDFFSQYNDDVGREARGFAVELGR